MMLTNRITRIVASPTKDCIIAADVHGQIHKLDLNLNLIQSSQATSYHIPINAIVVEKEGIFTRNRRGAIAKWDLETLRPITVHDDITLRKEVGLLEDEEPSPTSARGIGVKNGKVYTNNGYGQLVILDSQSLDVLDIREQMSEQFFDSFCTENNQYQAMGETSGYIHIGNLEDMEFPIKKKIDDNNIHWIRWDGRHNRFWATQDAGSGEDSWTSNGIITITPDGKTIQQFKFTYDDVEALEIDDEYKFVYVGAFDGNIYVFDNESSNITLSHIIGPFPYQILNLVYISSEQIYVLMQNGEIHCVNHKGEFKFKMDFTSRGIWEMAKYTEKNTIICAKDNGVDILKIEEGNFNSINLHVKKSHVYSFGIIKRIKPLSNGSYIATGHKGYLFKANKEGNLEWYLRLDGYPRSIDINKLETKTIVGTENGAILEIDISTGKCINTIDYKKPVWIVGYTHDNRKVASGKDGILSFYNNDNQITNTLDLDGVPKRWSLNNGKTFVVGSFGLLELDTDKCEINKQWVDLLINTKENGIVLGDFVHVVSYGYQLGTYIYENGEWYDLEENLQDFPASLHGYTDEEGNNYLFVGGRGGYINAFKVINGLPQKIREFYLN